MKRLKAIILIAVLLTATTSSSLFGQGAPKPIVGAKGGFSFADISGEADNKMKVAPHFGMYTEVFFDYFLMMQAEILFSFQGHAALDDFSSSLNLTYLNIPVMARYNLGYNLNVHAGIQFGFLLSANQVYTDQKFDVKDQFKGMELGLPIGVGYDFMDRKFNVTARYIIGLNNIAQSDLPADVRHNNVLQVSLGMLLFRVNE